MYLDKIYMCAQKRQFVRNVSLRRGNEMKMWVEPSLYIIALFLYVKVSGFNEKATEVRGTGGLLLLTGLMTPTLLLAC